MACGQEMIMKFYVFKADQSPAIPLPLTPIAKLAMELNGKTRDNADFEIFRSRVLDVVQQGCRHNLRLIQWATYLGSDFVWNRSMNCYLCGIVSSRHTRKTEPICPCCKEQCFTAANEFTVETLQKYRNKPEVPDMPSFQSGLIVEMYRCVNDRCRDEGVFAHQSGLPCVVVYTIASA